MEKRLKQSLEDINSLFTVKFKNLQTWNILTQWPIGESRLINGSVNTKISETPHQMRFLTKIPPGVSFDSHMHDCTEICTILSGQMKCTVSNQLWGLNEKAVFAIGQNHTPSNPSKRNDLHLIVDFIKPGFIASI